MVRPAGAKSLATRRRVLNAAEIEFAAAGFAGARMLRISQRAGLTHAMLHYYFDDKAKLYRAVLERLFKRHREILRRRGALTGQSDFTEIVSENYNAFCRHPRFVRIMLWELAAGAPRVESVAREFFDTLTTSIQYLDPLPGIDVRDAWATILGATIIYFFDDPSLVRLFGKRRFGRLARKRRGQHLATLTRLLLRERSPRARVRRDSVP